MKRVIKGALFFTMLAIFGTSCKKDKLDRTPSENVESTHIENGLWAFSSQDDYLVTVQKLASMSSDQRQKWGNEKNFVSQRMQFDAIIKAENEFEKEFMESLEPNQTLADLEKLGPIISHSTTYTEALNSGIITEIQEEKGGTSFVLNVASRSASYVTNESGMVVIEGLLYQHGKSTVKITAYNGSSSIQDLKNATTSNEEKEITVLNLEEKATNSFYRGNIFSPGSNSIIWYYNSPKERFKHSVHFTSTNFVTGGSSYAYCDYYTESIAQKKNFLGNWNTSFTYKPIKTLSGQSSSHYYKKKASSFDPPIYSGSLPFIGAAGMGSPFNVEYGNENDVYIQLYPSGTFPITSPYYYYTPVDINNGSTWHGIFWGGTSGYTTNYNR